MKKSLKMNLIFCVNTKFTIIRRQQGPLISVYKSSQEIGFNLPPLPKILIYWTGKTRGSQGHIVTFFPTIRTFFCLFFSKLGGSQQEISNKKILSGGGFRPTYSGELDPEKLEYVC